MAVKSMEEIASLLETVKFKKRLLGGVDEDDVWEVIERLQKEYRSLVEATEQRYGALLDERSQMLRRLQTENQQLKALTRSEEGSLPHG